HMLAFQEDFPDATLIKLEQNYRSTQVILDAANGVIAENRARLGKTLYTTSQGGDPVVVLTAADERDESEWLAGEFATLAAQTDIPYEGMAVLYRTNAQSRPLEEAFRFRGIPYRLIGAVSFYERREVKDLLAYLRLIANPADDGALARVVNVPRRGLGDASAAIVGAAATRWGKPLLEVVRAADRVDGLRPNLREGFRQFASLIDRLWEAFGERDAATVVEGVVAGLEEGLFPLGRTAGEPGGLEEERLLCYVGLTRAREKLYLSWARTRYRHGRLELSEPSRFLEALPPDVVEERSTTPLWDRGARSRSRRAAPAELDWEGEAAAA